MKFSTCITFLIKERNVAGLKLSLLGKIYQKLLPVIKQTFGEGITVRIE